MRRDSSKLLLLLLSLLLLLLQQRCQLLQLPQFCMQKSKRSSKINARQ